MKKYLLNRVLRSIFSIVVVMILSVVLIFTLVPMDYIISKNTDISTVKTQQGSDAAQVKTLEVLESNGYIDYVSQVDYCRSEYPDENGVAYKACVARYDSNKDKQNYLKKYRDLGWEEVRLVQYSKDNADPVTRANVIAGEYIVKDGQFFKTENADPAKDYLYEKVNSKDVIVTFNNITYFQKRRNPLKTFWNWFSNIITFDHKDKVENLVKWDQETQSYFTETGGEKYNFVFRYVVVSSGQATDTEYEYSINETDNSLVKNVISITDRDTNETNDYISIGGISTNVISDSKTLSDFSVNKNFIDEEDHTKGGSLDISGTFSDGTTFEITKEVAMYLKYDIPVYGGDDNKWYIGNTMTSIEYEKYIVDKLDWSEYYQVQKIHSWKFTDASVNRGYSIQLDEYGSPALTCSGCEHKYMIYFDNTFPYIHFNFIQFSLGKSVNLYKNRDIINIMIDKQGGDIQEIIEYPSGEVQKGSVSSFHTCTYRDTLGPTEYKLFTDNYANCDSKKEQSSMIGTSFIIGIISTLIAYFIGVPIGVLMGRYKEKLFDKIAMVYIIIMFSVPSLVYIYFFQYLGIKLFDLPIQYKYGEVLTYILPIISLSLGSIASMMMWTRRYIIDQGNSDYVKFARAKGLSETQIFFKHILRNAIVPIAHGVPGSIVGSIAGALITEQVYTVPGTGKLMVGALNNNDNWIALGLILFYTVLGIISLILGDVVITLVDPRISFVDTGGRK